MDRESGREMGGVVNTVCVPYTVLLEGRKEKDSKSVGYDNLNIHYISFIFSDILNIFKM